MCLDTFQHHVYKHFRFIDILHVEGIGWSVADSGVRKTAEEAKYEKVLDVDGCRWARKTIIKSKKHINIQEKLVSHNHTL